MDAAGRNLGWGRPRFLSGVEFVVAAMVVLGHNVWRVVPNEEPILVVAGLLSFRLRDGGWAGLGFRRPESWRRLILIAAAAAALRLVLGSFVVEPLTAYVWPPIKGPEVAADTSGNIAAALGMLGLVWTFAAFGEEIAYRGYATARAADVLGGSRLAWWLATLAVSILFGYGHYYKGPAGILDSGIAGLILGGAYLLAKRNLWASVLAHGFIDTTAVGLLYFGLDS